jgi:ribosomal protein S1
VFVDTGTKVDGVVEKSELLDEEGRLPLVEGDELDLYVVAADESEIRLSRAMSGIGGLNMLRDAWEQRVPVEGKVAAVIKGGLPGGGDQAAGLLPHQPDGPELCGRSGGLCGPDLPLYDQTVRRARTQHCGLAA